ncbi:hypothetical protein EVAR_103972_1 [Eumeta japonica]|uniref:Uncharacterized protein n=1 Tax=Eumeta variegata TaxID=151549 RepID=A0A4C1SVN8_EUMVA|nr:hypothetical protein EVAR_103972_1 [Eumeta japonica]
MHTIVSSTARRLHRWSDRSNRRRGPAAGARVRRKLSRPRPPGAAPPAAANCLEAAGRPAPAARRRAPGNCSEIMAQPGFLANRCSISANPLESMFNSFDEDSLWKTDQGSTMGCMLHDHVNSKFGRHVDGAPAFAARPSLNHRHSVNTRPYLLTDNGGFSTSGSAPVTSANRGGRAPPQTAPRSKMMELRPLRANRFRVEIKYIYLKSTTLQRSDKTVKIFLKSPSAAAPFEIYLVA